MDGDSASSVAAASEGGPGDGDADLAERPFEPSQSVAEFLGAVRPRLCLATRLRRELREFVEERAGRAHPIVGAGLLDVAAEERAKHGRDGVALKDVFDGG